MRLSYILNSFLSIALLCVVFLATSASAFTFSQSRGVIERAMKHSDKWADKTFYCNADIDFSVKSLNHEQLAKGIKQTDPNMFGWNPVDSEGGLIVRAHRYELEHVWPLSLAVGHLPDWKLGRSEAEKYNSFIRAVASWPHNLRFINGRINGDRSNKMFADILYEPPYGNCELRISRGKNGLFSPPSQIRGDIARAVLGLYDHFKNGREVSGDRRYLDPLPLDQKVLLWRWHFADPVSEIERLSHKLIAREWKNKELSNARREAKLFCKDLENETKCFVAELKRLKNIVVDMVFTNPLIVISGVD